MEKDIKKIADTVIEKPIEIAITREPKGWLDKQLIKLGVRSLKRTFFIKPPSLRLSYAITSLFADIKIPKADKGDMVEWGNQLRSENTHTMALIIATYLHGRPREQTPEELTDYVLDNLNDFELETITDIIREQCDIVPFTRSIASIRNLDIISPSLTKASPQDTGEIIAPGESSDQQRNISGSA